MKNKIFKKIALVAAFALIIAQIFALTTFAVESYEWGSEGEIYLDGELFEVYKSPVRLFAIATEIYGLQEDYYDPIFYNGLADDIDVVWYESDWWIFCVNDEGRKNLDDFLNGNIGGFLLDGKEDVFYNAHIGENTVTSLDSVKNFQEIDVKELKDYDIYEVLAYDESETVAYIYGAVYHDGETFYYVNYSTLGNQFFDADGNFSYRSGKVEVAVLDEALSAEVKEVIVEQAYDYPTYFYNDEISDDFDIFFDEASSVVIFWISFVVLGFIFPIPFIVLGLVFPRSKKLGERKYWYGLAVLGTVWLILAIALMLLVILV